MHRTTFWTTTNLALEEATQLRLPYSRLQRPWDWQEQLPNPLYSSWWICLLLLTQLTTRSSCPPSETALLWFESYLSDRSSGVLEGWGFEVTTSCFWSSSRLSAWTTSLLHLHVVIRFSHSEAWLFLPLLCWMTLNSTSHSNQMIRRVTARIAACLSDISSWWWTITFSSILLRQNCLWSQPPITSPQLLYTAGLSTITPSRTSRNLGVVIDDQLSFTDHIATTAWSCRFALYNIRKIRPFLSEQAAQLLVQALVLSRLDYCNAFWRAFPHVLSSLCNWSRMQQPEWSLWAEKSSRTPLSSGYTGYQ